MANIVAPDSRSASGALVLTEDAVRLMEVANPPTTSSADQPRGSRLRTAGWWLAVCVAPLASGLALGLCFTEPALRPLAWIALVPFAWTLTVARQRGLYLAILAGAVICHLMGLEFIRDAYSGTVRWGWITLSVVASLPWLAAALAGRALLRRFVVPMTIALPLVWVTMELARMYFIALFTEVSFPYMQLGTLIVDSRRLVQVADIGGVWGLTWIVAAANGAIFDALRAMLGRRRDRTSLRTAIVGAGSTCVLLAGAWLYGAWRLSESPGRSGPIVALVPGSLRTPLDANGTEKLTGQIRHALGSRRPALLVWSEGACPFPIITEEGLSGEVHGDVVSDSTGSSGSERDSTVRLQNLSRDMGAAVLAGCERHEIVRGEPIVRVYNSLALASPAGGYQGYYDKIYLVPWREFQPLMALTLGLLPAHPGHPAYAGPLRPGNRYSTFKLADAHGDYQIGCSICFEVSFAKLHRQLAANLGRNSPAFFVGIANESAFKGPLYKHISFDAQRLRAIECRLAYVRIANQGLSSFVDGNGQVLAAQDTTDESQALAGVVPIDDRFSLYVVCGDWLPFAACVALVLFGAVAIAGARRARGRPHNECDSVTALPAVG